MITSKNLKMQLPEPNDYVKVKEHITDNLLLADEEIFKKASKTELGRVIIGDNLTIDETGRLSGNPVVDISGKMDKYQLRYDIKDYDDLTEDGFYILTGSASSSPSTNAPYSDSALVQVWNLSSYIYQHAVSYYNVECQYTRCFQKGAKNTRWERIINSKNYYIICPYSIGDLMLTVSSQHPAVKWIGTTWVKIEGRFLLGSGGGYNLGWTGGSPVAALNVSNIPSHTHSATQSAHAHTQPAHVHSLSLDYMGASNSEGFAFNRGNKYGYTTNYQRAAGGENTGGAQPAITVGYTGSGAAFSIMPPYIVVNIWKRIS